LFEVAAKAIYLLNFTLDHLRARLQFGVFQGCGAVVKMIQLRLRSSPFHERGSSSGVFGFHECGSGFCSFSHIDILIVSASSSSVENELNQVHKTKKICQTLWSNLML